MIDDPLTERVIGAAIQVHRELGPGLLESAYATALEFELAHRAIPLEREKSLPLVYRGHRLDAYYRIDFLVEGQLVIEVKSVEALHPIHLAQMITYLRLGGYRRGLLANFNAPALRQGLKRVVL